jgi:hypothetical protein
MKGAADEALHDTMGRDQGALFAEEARVRAQNTSGAIATSDRSSASSASKRPSAPKTSAIPTTPVTASVSTAQVTKAPPANQPIRRSRVSPKAMRATQAALTA